MKCRACGAAVAAESVYCPQCGVRLAEEKTSAGAAFQSAARPDSAERTADRADKTPEAEHEHWQGGFSAKAMYGRWLAGGLVTAVLLVVGVVSPPALLPIAAVVAALWLYLIGYLLIRKLGVHYTLTSQRLIHQSGILVRTTDRIEVLEIDDVTFSQGIVERMLGVGTIRIASSDASHPEIWLHGIDDVQRVSGLLDDVRRKERRRRGVFMEQI